MGNRRTEDRRTPSERRQSSDRRRSTDNRRPVFEVCRSTLHLAMISLGDEGEPDRVVTRSIRWRQEAKSLQSDTAAKELGDAFRLLVEQERLVGANARIALSGEFCVTRVVTGSRDEVRRELGELEERSSHYLSLGPGTKTIATSVQQLDARHNHALLSVVNQNTLDMIAGIAAKTGLQVEAIEPSLVALSRAQARLRDGCHDACVIVQLDEGGAELGICHEGRLLLEYHPGGRADAENIAQLVEQHLIRLQRHLYRKHSYLKAPLEHIYLTGEPATVKEAQAAFAESGLREVHLFEPAELDVDWEHAGDMPGTEYAAALGCSLQHYPGSEDLQSPNLIAQMLAESREPIRRTLIQSSIPLVAVLLVAVCLAMLWLRVRSHNHSLQAQLESYLPARVRADELRLQLIRTDSKLAGLRELDSRLPQRNWRRLVERIAQSMPDDVWLNRVSVRDSQAASISGASYTDSGVYDFVSYLKEVPEVSQIALEGTGVGHTPNGPTTDFDLQLSLTPLPRTPGNEDHND